MSGDTIQPIVGVIAIDKMAGHTSAKTVAAVRKLFFNIKAGHAGTLDPMATGVLPVLLGEATAFARFLPPQKTYQAEIYFGASTDTDDAEGEILNRRAPPSDLAAALQAALPSFVGDIEQTAPTYSALKHQGKPMYYYARGNITVPPKRRRVRAYEVRLESVTGDYARLRICCGGGFYVRALARDLGERLQCGAYLSALRRLRCVSLDIAAAVNLDSLSAMCENARRDYIVAVEKSLTHLPVCELNENEVRILGRGGGNFDTIEKAKHAKGVKDAEDTEGEQVCFVAGGRFAGVGRRRDEQYRGQKMLAWTREL